jgi:hypothetical protein
VWTGQDLGGTAYFFVEWWRTADVTAQKYMQPITDSARGMVNTVLWQLVEWEEVTGMGEAERLKLKGNWKDLVKKSLSKKKPAEGWPRWLRPPHEMAKMEPQMDSRHCVLGLVSWITCFWWTPFVGEYRLGRSMVAVSYRRGRFRHHSYISPSPRYRRCDFIPGRA